MPDANVEEDGHRARETPASIAIEVDVEREMATGQGDRRTCAGEVRVGDEPLDARERGDEVEERHPAEFAQDMPHDGRGIDEARALELTEARALLRMVTALPARMRGRWKLLAEDACERRLEEVVEDEMGKRPREAVAVMRLTTEKLELPAIEKGERLRHRPEKDSDLKVLR